MRANIWLKQKTQGELTPTQSAPAKIASTSVSALFQATANSDVRGVGSPSRSHTPGGSSTPYSVENPVPVFQASRVSSARRVLSPSKPATYRIASASASRRVLSPRGSDIGKETAESPERLSSWLHDLQESMKSLQAEVSKMSQGIRMVIRQELDQSTKPLYADERMSQNLRSIIRAEFEDSMQSLNMELGVDESQLSQLIHNELEQFFQKMKQHEDSGGIKSALARSSGILRQLSPVTEDSVPHRVSFNEPEMPFEALEALSTDSSPKAIQPRLTVALTAPNLQTDLTEPLIEDHQKAELLRKDSHGKRDRRSTLNLAHRSEKEKIKKTLQEAMNADVYNVEDYYHDTGFWQRLARQDSWFSNASLAVIGVNVIWIGIDEDLNQADVLCEAPWQSQVINNAFCTFFTFELLVHFMAFKHTCRALRDKMFLFDLVLVSFMVWETWIEVFLYLAVGLKDNNNSAFATQLFRFFRLIRLTRVPRIVRLSMSLPELMIMMKGIAVAMRSVMVILVFLLFTVFIFGILFTELLKDVSPFKADFATVPKSMYTLFLQVICGVDSDWLGQLQAASAVYYVVYLIFTFLSVFTLLNMLIGVLCDVVSNVADEEKENIVKAKLEDEITKIADAIDLDHNGRISKYEFDELMSSKEALKSLDAMGVDVSAFGGLEQFIFINNSELSLSEFCELIAQFRGQRAVCVKDLVDTHKFITMELDSMVAEMKRLFLMHGGAQQSPRSLSSSPAHGA
mmetsp:Transcript_123780/g.228138  ORF Transcript_123780/g.228138 Transcript_123780/m.228138 type:complete len:742 (-) Transcript_123780:215-2440(-)